MVVRRFEIPPLAHTEAIELETVHIITGKEKKLSLFWKVLKWTQSKTYQKCSTLLSIGGP